MHSTRRYSPYIRPDHPQPPARWASHQTHDTHEGKGKGRQLGHSERTPAEPQREPHVLLQQTFHIDRIATLAPTFPLSPTSATSSRFRAFASALERFLAQQLALGLDPDLRVGRKDQLVKRVEAGYVNLRLGSKDGAVRRPVLIQVELGDENPSSSRASTSSSTATFILLPSLPEDLDTSAPGSPAFPLLLSKSASASLTHLFTTFLSTRFDALIHPFRIPPPSMLALLESLVRPGAHSPSSDDNAPIPLATTLAFAFPPQIARVGLSTLSLTLPPEMLPSLVPGEEGGSFVARLAAHLERHTALPLGALELVRVGAGRGSFVHSGAGGAGGAGSGGARVKFFPGAEDDEGSEMRRVCEELVRGARR
ncbi:hypothetical protein Rhopal_001079-T1 [Rhodotorula paludigena]|uniref:Kinetochore complex Sim4 subunit Fta1-domain-containing protein n=1 Tax=Rhodotorula paludigena TaxID=86838 RepID=A0AAV5GDD4_9BASI|nr:hypothetical protein Rhopal_001079-T1 [Rhodotorula paludigena]